MAKDKQIRLKITADNKRAVQALNKVEKEQKDIKKQNDKLKSSFSAMGGVIAAAFSIRAIAQFTTEAVKLGSQTIGLERAFKNLGKAVNFNEQSLDKFRKATDGTVSDIDLMTQANNAMLLGIVESDDQFAELIDNAQRLAQAVGKDAVFGIESLTTGIGRQSKLMLDNLGIIVDTNRAYEIYAESIGKSTSELDDNERKQAFIQATMESVAEKVNQLGDEQLTASSATEALSSSFNNLKATIGKDLQDEVITTTSALGKMIDEMNREIEDDGLGAFIVGAFTDGPMESFALLRKFITQTLGYSEKEWNEYLEKIGMDTGALEIPLRPKIELVSEDDEDILGDFKIDETSSEDLQSGFIEAFGIGELEKTEILKAAALERQEIRREEELGEVPMSIFAESVNNMDISESAKTKLIEEHSKRRRDFESKAHKERIKENLESAILSGQSAKEAAQSVIKAEVAEAQASLISSIMTKLPFPVNLAVAAGAGAMIGKVTDQLLSFETGGSFVTKGRTTLPIGNGVVVGDNASGMERIDVTPLPSPTSSGSNIVVNINAPVVDEYVVDSIIPAIRRAEKLNL